MPTKHSGTFSLGGLFQLITILSVMLGLVGFLFQSKLLPPRGFAFALALGAFAGAIAGVLIGLYHHRRFRGVTIGFFTGMCFGALVGPLSIASLSDQGFSGSISPYSVWIPTIISLIGGGFLVMAALVYRMIDRSDPVSKKHDFSQFLQDKETRWTKFHQSQTDTNTDGIAT